MSYMHVVATPTRHTQSPPHDMSALRIGPAQLATNATGVKEGNAT